MLTEAIAERQLSDGTEHLEQLRKAKHCLTQALPAVILSHTLYDEGIHMTRPRGSRRRSGAVETLEPTSPEIDFLILADAAEAVNGKLYMLGGGFDRFLVQDFNEPVTFCVALGVVIPWAATNVLHQVSIVLQTQDGQKLEPEMGVAFNAGRPPQAGHGESFRATITARLGTKLPGPGAYVLVADLPGSRTKRTVFYAIDAKAVPGGLPPGFMPGL